MKRKFITSITYINIGILAVMAIVIFLILPEHVQKTTSYFIYVFAVVAGLLIGNLAARIIFLRKKIEKEKAEMEEMQQNIQTYIGNVVHDLRSPVASINMIADLLESDLMDIDPMHKQLINSIKKSSETMLDRICYILDNARQQQSGIFDNMVAGNPIDLIRVVIDKLHILAIEKNIKIILSVDTTLPDVYFEKEALDSIFSNLISNAIKYSPQNTQITISNSMKKGCVTYRVKDQGLGMTEEDLSKVFGRFVKLSARPTGGEDSSGLGLSIVKDLAEKMNGSVKAESDGKGKGSTFSITLSCTPCTKPSP
jgi:signal transduction histidine kinase